MRHANNTVRNTWNFFTTQPLNSFVLYSIKKLNSRGLRENKCRQCEQQKQLVYETVISFPRRSRSFWYSRGGNEDLPVPPQTACSQVGQQTAEEVSKLVCQIIEIHQWESEKLGESRPTDCNDPVYRGRGDSAEVVFPATRFNGGSREGWDKEETHRRYVSRSLILMERQKFQTRSIARYYFRGN